MGRRQKDPAPGSWVVEVRKRVIPLSVAAGAALFVAAGLDVVHRHQSASDEKYAAAKPASKSASTEPRFVVGVRDGGDGLVVRDVRNRRSVGLPVAAPEGRRFQQVAAAKGGTYIVGVSSSRGVEFQRLRLEKDGRPKALEYIPNTGVPGISTPFSDLAVNPDGDRLAYVTYRGTASRIDVVSVSTGNRKTWTSSAPARISSLSWAGDTLSFVWNPLRMVGGKLTEVRHQVRALDTKIPDGDLKLSKAVLTLPKGASAALLNRDGRTLMAGVVQNGELSVQAYAVGTGKPANTLWKQKVESPIVRLAVDRTGEHVLAASSDGRLYAKGIPGMSAADLVDAAW